MTNHYAPSPVWDPYQQRWVAYPQLVVYSPQQHPRVMHARFPHIPWVVATVLTGGLAGLWYLKAYTRFRLAPNRAIFR